MHIPLLIVNAGWSLLGGGVGIPDPAEVDIEVQHILQLFVPVDAFACGMVYTIRHS